MSASNHFLPSSLRLLSTQSCHYGANVCFRPKADTWERRTKGALSITALALYRPAPLPMRRLHLIKPPNGWPDFINELVIVVLGVLIALGAQELLNKWNARRDLDEFRSAVDQEIADNLAAYEQRVRQSSCAGARLDQLEACQKTWREGSGPAMLGRIRRPIEYTVSQHVWSSGFAANLREMPLDERLTYAGLYALFEAYENQRLRDAAIWQELYAYDQATSLSPPEVNKLRGLILSARALGNSIDGNFEQLKQQARAVGIRPTAYNMEQSALRLCAEIEFTPPASR